MLWIFNMFLQTNFFIGLKMKPVCYSREVLACSVSFMNRYLLLSVTLELHCRCHSLSLVKNLRLEGKKFKEKSR